VRTDRPQITRLRDGNCGRLRDFGRGLLRRRGMLRLVGQQDRQVLIANPDSSRGV
jgi:hypothetical protein